MSGAMTKLASHAPHVILLASLAALGTALASQYWGGLTPCELCIAQRWPYVASAIVGLAAMFVSDPRQRRLLITLAGLIFLVDAGIALYHTGFEQAWWDGPSACKAEAGGALTMEQLRASLLKAPVVACNQPQWTFHGLSMAAFNFAAALVFAAVTFQAAFTLDRKSR